MSETFRIGVRHTAYHYALRQWRESQGYNKAQAARAIGIAPGQYGLYENLKELPTPAMCLRIERVTFLSPDEISPPWLRDKLKGVGTSVDTVHELTPLSLDDPHQAALVLPDPEAAAMAREAPRLIRAALATLPPRWAAVLTYRHGLDGAEPRTLAEVGALMDRSVEGIRQVEAKALKRLRHPRVRRTLRDLLDVGV